jgi:phosphoribosylanthranilate isomerase
MPSNMKVKVCGIKSLPQIKELIDMPVHYIGINFYMPSPRYYTGESLGDSLTHGHDKLVGVFVNEKAHIVKEICNEHGIKAVQLHGNESINYCEELKKEFTVFKAFGNDKIAFPDYLHDYNICDYYLFDKASPQHGGTGQKFDWSLLDRYNGQKSFFVAGGVSVNDTENIRNITKHAQFAGVDINSKFEISPGIKDMNLINNFLKEIL